MGSPITFVFDFKHRGSSNTRRESGYVPTLNTKRFRPPRQIVSRLAHLLKMKQEMRKIGKRNKRRERNFTKNRCNS